MGFEAGAALFEEVLAEEAVAAVGEEALASTVMEAGAGELVTSGVESSLADYAFNTEGVFGPQSQGFMPGEVGGMPAGSVDPWGRFINQAIGTGVNLSQAQQLQNLAKTADPFAGYRPQFAQQLSQLMANPSMVTQMPGYTAGMTAAEQALTRNLASQGLTGSGTAGASLANFGAQYQDTAFKQLLNQLSGLSGANISGAGTNLQGTMAGMNLQNQALLNLYKAFPSGGAGGMGAPQTPGMAWEPIGTTGMTSDLSPNFWGTSGPWGG